MMIPFLFIAVLYYLLIVRPQRREQQRHEEMLNALKKNDQVLTRGGILGSVANVSSDGQKVTIKVDDNVRIPIHRNYIVTVLKDEQGAGEKKGEPAEAK